MFTCLSQATGLDQLTERVRSAAEVDCSLLADVVAKGCVRFPVMQRAGRTVLLHRFVELGAWTAAALALVEIELPRWKLRRLVLEDSQWLCSLSRQVNMPLWLDDLAEGRHEEPALAALGSLVEARRRDAAEPPTASEVPQISRTFGYPVCPDNFA
jgi:hypothetical protein